MGGTTIGAGQHPGNRGGSKVVGNGNDAHKAAEKLFKEWRKARSTFKMKVRRIQKEGRMKRAILVLLFVGLSFCKVMADDNTATLATLDDGQRVVLLPDSTWKYLTRNPNASAPANQDENTALMATTGDGQRVVLLSNSTWELYGRRPSY